jgi:hypothetical protein
MTSNRLMLFLICCALASFVSLPAEAISLDLAKKCRGLAIKTHPYQLPGERAGSASAERSYFSDCVSHDGNMPAGANTSAPSATTNSDANVPATPQSTSK